MRGAGSPVIAHAEELGMRVYLVGEKSVDEALAAYRAARYAAIRAASTITKRGPNAPGPAPKIATS